MKKSTIFIFLFSVFLFSNLFISCNTVDLINFSKDIKFDESLVLPIGESNQTVKDIFTKFGTPNNIDTLNNDIFFQWSFNSEESYNSLNFADSIFPFDKTVFQIPYSYVFPSNTPIELPPYLGQFDLHVNKTGNTDRIDSLNVNSSVVNVKIDVTPDIAAQILPGDLTVEFVFDDSKLIMESNVNPNYTPTVYGQYGQVYIGRYKLKLIGSNIIPFKINFYVKNQLMPVVLTPESSITLNMNFSKVDYSVAYGFFNLLSNETSSIQMPIKIEDYLPDALLRFAYPKINVSLSTNLGANVNVNIAYLRAYNSTNPSNFVYAWFNNHTTNAITENLIGPTVVGDWSTLQINQYDNKNGEIDHFFDTRPYPNMLGYKLTSKADANRTLNYLTSDNKLRLKVNASLPLKLKGGSYYNLTDTIHNINVASLLENVDSAILVLTFRNGLPMKAKFRMTYWKSTLPNDTVSAVGGGITEINDVSIPGNLTSVYNINSPKVDSLGNVTEITPQTIKVILNKSQIIDLQQTKFIVNSIYFDGDKTIVAGVEKQNAMHFTTKNNFDIKLGIFIKANKTMSLSK